MSEIMLTARAESQLRALKGSTALQDAVGALDSLITVPEEKVAIRDISDDLGSPSPPIPLKEIVAGDLRIIFTPFKEPPGSVLVLSIFKADDERDDRIHEVFESVTGEMSISWPA